MKKSIFLQLCLLSVSVYAQNSNFKINKISLPAEISYYDNQFSGLCIHAGMLFLMSESRLQDKAEGKLYAIKLIDIERTLTDTSFVLPFQKFHLYNLEKLRAEITAKGQNYEGLEAISMDGDDVYLSVETDTPSNSCFLLKGKLNDTSLLMDTEFLVPVPKPVSTDGSHIYNAGFEAITMINKQIYSFYEYNYFPISNYVSLPNMKSGENDNTPKFIPISRIPFRLTDITQSQNHHLTAINYFFKGGGADAVYRTTDDDIENMALIKDKNEFHSYCRLIDIVFDGNKFTWKPLWEFPVQYMDYNWEGIAAYKNGYFVINDKYTSKRPYQSVLLYIQPQNMN